MQEAALFEELYSLDVDPRQFAEYSSSYEALTCDLSGAERMSKLSADRELNNTNNSSSGGGSGDSGSTRGAVQYTEEVVEVDTEGLLPGYEETALTDPIVLQYATSSTSAGSSGDGVESTGNTCYCMLLLLLFEEH